MTGGDLTTAVVLLGLRDRLLWLGRGRVRAWLGPWPFVAAGSLLGLSRDVSGADLAAGAGALLLVFGLGKQGLRRFLNALLGLGALLLLAVAILPAPFWRLHLPGTPPYFIGVVQWHYAMVVGPADLLAAGYRLFSDVQPAYGVWPAVLAAALHRLVRPLSWGDDVRLLQAVQALYLILAAVLYRRYGRYRGAWVFAGLVLVVPWYHFCQPGLFVPNLTPWRLIPLPLGLLIAATFVLGRTGLRDERLDLRARAILEPSGRRVEEVMESCHDRWLPAWRRQLEGLLAAYRAAGIQPVLVTHPALFGRGRDPATGLNLATLAVHLAAGINGALAWDVLEAYNDVVSELGRTEGAPVIELARTLPKDSRLFEDFVRLSEAGAEEAARRVAEPLFSMLIARFPEQAAERPGRKAPAGARPKAP